MRRIYLGLLLILFIQLFADFSEPIKIDGTLKSLISSESCLEVQGENIYFVYSERFIDDNNNFIYIIKLKYSNNNGETFSETEIYSGYTSYSKPAITILSNNEIVIFYSTGSSATYNLYKAVSADGGESFETTSIADIYARDIVLENRNDQITLYLQSFAERGAESVEEVNSINQDERNFEEFEENGLKPFPDDADIVYVKLCGSSYVSKVGYKEHVADSTFTVYDSYPDAAHPEIPIGNPIWENEIAIYDTVWVDGPSGTIDNQVVWVECELWIEGEVTGKQTWASGEIVYMTDDLYYTNTPIYESPSSLVYFNSTDLLGLYSAKKILIKYKHFDSFAGHRVAPNCDGLYVFGYLMAYNPDVEARGHISFEYQHPHGSTPNFWWTNPETNEEQYLTYIDLHKYIFPENLFVPDQYLGFVMHSNSLPYGYPTSGFPYEDPDYASSDVPPYGIDYPWYNPVWPESSDDIIFDRGVFQHRGGTIQEERGFMWRSGTDPYNHIDNSEWNIDEFHYGGTHNPLGYTKDYSYDYRIFNYMSVAGLDMGYAMGRYVNITLLSDDNCDNFYELEPESLGFEYNTKDICSDDERAVIVYSDQEEPGLVSLKIIEENSAITRGIDISVYPEIFNPIIKECEIYENNLYILLINQAEEDFISEDNFIIQYDFESDQLIGNNSYQTPYNYSDYSITSDGKLLMLNAEIPNFGQNPENTNLIIKQWVGDSWQELSNQQTELPPFVAYFSSVYGDFFDGDLYLIFDNVVNNYNFNDLYLVKAADLDYVSTIENETEVLEMNLRCYPNPFIPYNSERGQFANICFNLKNDSNVKVVIYNIKGQKVNILQNSLLEPGSHIIKWNGRDKDGSVVTSGIYFYQLRLDNKPVQTGKLMLLK